VGDLTTGRIVIEDGANFKGSIEIVRQTTDAASEKPPQSFAATASAADSQRK
jgi:cytoskeletal protein CcmA (bactofilin family)